MNPPPCFPGTKLTCTCGAVNEVPDDPEPIALPASAHVQPKTAATAAHAHLADHACPRCSGALHPEVTHDESMLVCGGCRGVFVDHETLARATETAHAAHASHASDEPRQRQPRAPEGEVRYLKCPHCAQVMNRMNFGRRSGIVVDTCKAHGTWLDAGELDAVLAFVASGGLDESEAHARHDRQADLSPENRELLARAAVQMEAGLHEERLQDARRIEAATELVDDLLWFILPGDRYGEMRRRRRRF